MSSLASPQPAAKSGKIESLEGLRGVAVICVVLYHFLPAAAPAGFLGVDVFFVLSGFVITRTLLEEYRATGEIRYGRFLFRRAMRLMPALWLVVAFVCVVCLLWPLQIWRHAPSEIAWALAYVSNWQAAYPATFGPSMFFNHAWSLGVEQQFYLAWPLVLVLLLRGAPAGRLARWLAAMIALAALWRLGMVAAGHDTNRLYHGSDMRIDELLAGCVLAVLARDRAGEEALRRHLSRARNLGAAVAAMLVAAVFIVRFEDRALYMIGFPLVALLAAALIAECVCFPERLAPRLLRGRPLVALGTISYGVYLWHIPLWEALKGLQIPPLAASAIASVLTVCFASFSYRVIELRSIAFAKASDPAPRTRPSDAPVSSV